MIEPQLYDLVQQALRLILTLAIPTLAIPVVSFIFSFIFGLVGIRDEGVGYALRVLALIALGFICAPIFSGGLTGLMTEALK
jgi:type III secretory pathway component EscS